MAVNYINGVPNDNTFDAPDIEVRISTPGGSRAILSNLEITHSVVNVEIDKQLSNHAGTWSVSFLEEDKININKFLVKKNTDIDNFVSWRSIFKTKSFVKIKINNVTKMVGLLDNYKRSVAIGGAKIITLMGRDLGAVFLDYKRWYSNNTYSPFATANIRDIKEKNLSTSYLRNKNFSGNINQIVKDIFTDWMLTIYTNKAGATSDELGWHIYDDFGNILPLDEVMLFDSIPDNLYANTQLREHTAYLNEGDFFSIFEQFVSRPLNEMWVASGAGNTVTVNTGEVKTLEDGLGHLIIRPSPYSTNFNKPRAKAGVSTPTQLTPLLQLEDLERFRIIDASLQRKTLTNGMSSTLYSNYSIQTTGLSGVPMNLEQIAPPFFDERVLRLNGYNPMNITMSALGLKSFDKSQELNLVDTISSLQYLLYTWFRFNDLNLRGTFDVLANEKEKAFPGMAVELSNSDDFDEERLYYCTGVKDSWQMGKRYVATFTVEHGIKDYKV